MKIGRISINGYDNYGNTLQTYALQQVLKHYADEVDTLWDSQFDFLPLYSRKWNLKKIIKFILNWRGCRTYILSDKFGLEMARQTRIRDFCEKNINFRFLNDDIKSIKNEYDYFVVGSDQVWNPSGNGFKNYFLTFAPAEKRISYAASISRPDVPARNLDEFKDGINGMKNISVREQAGGDLIEHLTGRKVDVHVDPTLLVSAEEWCELEEVPLWYKGGKFILTYFLGERPPIVEKLSTELGVPVVNLLDSKNYTHYVTNIAEFLWAIDHAELVYTDSFHGTVFSILFRTPFVVCNRIGSGMFGKMGSRIDTLLGYFGLEARRGTKENGYAIENPLVKPDWSQVDEVLNRERKRADDYLRQALGIDA